MNSIQRLFNNAVLAFLSKTAGRISDFLIFIFIARSIGAEDAGIFRLAKTFLALAIGLSAWGLQDLFIREASPRKEQSGKYLFNFLAVRLTLATIAFTLLLLILYFQLPYSQFTKQIISIVSFAILPEAALVICEAFFVTHEQLFPLTFAAITSNILKLISSVWIINQGWGITALAWLVPIGSIIGLLVLLPFILRILKRVRQSTSIRLNLGFIYSQLSQLSGFIMIGIFYNLNAQQDAFLISLFLSEQELGWYGAAQNILLGFLMLSVSTRTVIYPIMSRFQYESQEKLIYFYRKLYQYLIIGILPITILVTLLADQIIIIIFKKSFSPAIPALQWMIWEIFFTFLHIPNVRIMLVQKYQKQLGWQTGFILFISLSLNLWLIPKMGILGAAIARPLTAGINFLIAYIYVQRHIIRFNILPLLIRPFIASGVMIVAIILLQGFSHIFGVLTGGFAYIILLILTGAFKKEDRAYLEELLQRRKRPYSSNN